MNTVRITRREFCEAIDRIHNMYKAMAAVEEFGINFSDYENPFWDMIDGEIDLLSNMMYDDPEFPCVSDFCWSYDFGNNGALEVSVVDEEGKEKNLYATDASSLYTLMLYLYNKDELF